MSLPTLSDEPWRERAACAQHDEPWLWDAVRYEGEPRKDRETRHRVAKWICKTRCPVRDSCIADIDLDLDEGVRGGMLLRNTFLRRDLRREPCPECAVLTVVNKMSRHRLTHQPKAS